MKSSPTIPAPIPPATPATQASVRSGGGGGFAKAFSSSAPTFTPANTQKRSLIGGAS